MATRTLMYTWNFDGRIGPTVRAHSNQVKELMGMNPKAKYPVEGMPPREIQGITVYVNSLIRGTRKHNSKHRVMAICPNCGKHLTLGRLFSHVCKVKTSHAKPV